MSLARKINHEEHEEHEEHAAKPIPWNEGKKRHERMVTPLTGEHDPHSVIR